MEQVQVHERLRVKEDVTFKRHKAVRYAERVEITRKGTETEVREISRSQVAKGLVIINSRSANSLVNYRDSPQSGSCQFHLLILTRAGISSLSLSISYCGIDLDRYS